MVSTLSTYAFLNLRAFSRMEFEVKLIGRTYKLQFDAMIGHVNVTQTSVLHFLEFGKSVQKFSGIICHSVHQY